MGRHLGVIAAALAVALVAACKAPPQKCEPRGQKDAGVYVGFIIDHATHPICVDKYPASRLDARRNGPGTDESFAASQPHVIPWTDVTYEEAAKACGRGGKFLCRADMLKAIGEFRDKDFMNPDPYPYASRVKVIPDYDVPPQEGLEIGPYGMRPQIPFPGATGSIIFMGAENKLVGKIVDTRVQSDGSISALPGSPATWRHALVGFRCCVDSRLWDLFQPFEQQDGFVIAQEPNVPLLRDPNAPL
jgi:hypothetical protein